MLCVFGVTCGYEYIGLKGMSAEEVKKGLISTPKYIPFHYIYDQHGSHLYDNCVKKNTNYYMCKAELSVLHKHITDVVNNIAPPCVLVDMGCGNCEKSKIFIDAILKRQDKLLFVPIDISKDYLLWAAELLVRRYGNKCDVRPVAEDYNEGIKRIRNINGNKLIIWLGGLQNEPYEDQIDRLRSLSQSMSVGDRVILSLDVTQDAKAVEMAYLDQAGVFAEFYSNMFRRINRDYGSRIDSDKLQFEAKFQQRKETNTCSCLKIMAKATEAQSHTIPGLNMTLTLEKDEVINLFEKEATSCKYTLDQIQALVQAGNQQLDLVWIDENHNVALSCLSKK